MTAKFTRLEVVTYVGHRQDSMAPEMVRYVNRQCVIVNPLGIYEGEPYLRYGVKFSDGVEAWVVEGALQKYRTPEDQIRHFRDQLKTDGRTLEQVIAGFDKPDGAQA
jgi:hypothetical protein